MRQCRTRKSEHAFTLIEMLFAMTILGIVLGLITLEFTAAIQNFRFSNAHLDAETQARVAMAKVNDVMKMGTPDVNDPPCVANSQKCSVLANFLQVASPNGSVSFFEVTDDHSDPGHLSDAGMTLNPGNGEPKPQYEVVTILLDNVKNELDLCRIKDTSFDPASPCAGSTGTQVLAYDVTNFNVTPIGCPIGNATCQSETGTLQVDISTTNNTNQNTGSSTSGQTAESAQVTNTLFFSSWKAFH